MTDQEIRLKFGEMNAGEMRLARALVDWHEREIANLKAALPDRPQVQPSPWPGQQEAIDAAFQQIDEFYLDYKSSHDDWEHEAPARLAIAQAYDAARPQAAEIASLKAELAASRESESIAPSMQLQRLACEKGNKEAIQEVQKYASTLTVEGINGLLKAIHECLPETQPILADDGRSLGKMASEAYHEAYGVGIVEKWQRAAQAVAAVVLAQAVRRMESVPQEEMWKIYKDAPHRIAQKALESVRARLIAAAHGFGKAKPVVVNETPQDEKQPDLSGEGEKQPDKPAQDHGKDWTPENAKAYEDFQAELRETWAAQPWTPAVGDTVRSIPEMALGGQMYWRDLAIQLARVWWKCHNIGASLQHGDLDKDIAFSIVCERHGGKVFHGDTPENAWHKAEEWMLSPDRENFPAACLTPAKP